MTESSDTAAKAPERDLPTSSNPGEIRNDRLLALLLFAVAFGVYAATCCRTIYTGDDGDFATAVATFGIPHPTGYPLFILFGHLWITLTAFLGDVPFRLNIMTALCGAGGVGMFCRFLCNLFDGYPWRRLWAAAGALLLAFAPTLWQQSLSCEVYAPNILFLATLLYLTLGWVRMPDGDPADQRLCLIAFTYGLALTNHLTMALFFPGFMALVIWRKPTLFGRDWQILLAVVGCLFLPLSLYIYLPLSAKYSSSPAKWGLPEDGPSFWAHITGSQYRDEMFSSKAHFIAGLRNYFTNLLPNEFGGIPLLAIAVCGAVLTILRRETRVLGILMVYIFAADITYSCGYSIPDIYVYFVPSYLVVSGAIAMAGAEATKLLVARLNWDRVDERKYVRLAAPVLGAAILVHLSMHYSETDKSGNYLEADYAASILHGCPQHAVLAVRSQVTVTLWYRQFVLHDRPDVLVISQDTFSGLFVGNAWYLHHLLGREPDMMRYLPPRPISSDDFNDGTALAKTLVNFVRDGRPVLVVPVPDMGGTIHQYLAARKRLGLPPGELPDWYVSEERLTDRFDRVPWGVTERLYLKGTAPSPAAICAQVAPLWSGDSPAVNPRWTSLVAYKDSDSEQTPIVFRWWESLTAWGHEAEAGNRPDLAVPAYEHALTLFDDPAIRAALARCQAETNQIPAPPRPKAP